MFKKYFSNIQKDILEFTGTYKIYVIVLVLFCFISVPEYKVITFLPRLVIAAVGFAHLLPIYILLKGERSKKQSRTIGIYIFLFIAFFVSTLTRMLS